jgi:hypothetical protein
MYTSFSVYNIKQYFLQSPSPPPSTQKQSMSRKRAASPDKLTPAKKKGRISGPAAVSDVATALREMVSSFNGNNDDADHHAGDPSTPQRRSKAIRTIEKDQELNGNERIKAMRLFKRDIAAADLYLAINDPAVRAEVIRLEIEDF